MKTTAPTLTDLPAQALLLSGLRRAAHFPLCASERQAVTTQGGSPAGFSCPRCSDFETVVATAAPKEEVSCCPITQEKRRVVAYVTVRGIL